MKVFISWSGERSQALANALRDWLPNVIQAVRPWMSEVDIDKGSRWSTDIAQQLSEAKVGIICLTPENLEAPWILFEAGALSKTLEKTYVCPYLFQVEPANIKGPLVQFQVTRANENDTLKLIHTINQALGEEAIPKEKLNEAFEVWWPRFEKSLKSMPDTAGMQESQRSEREILEEILELVREQTRTKKSNKVILDEKLRDNLMKWFLVLNLSEKDKISNELWDVRNYCEFIKDFKTDKEKKTSDKSEGMD